MVMEDPRNISLMKRENKQTNDMETNLFYVFCDHTYHMTSKSKKTSKKF